MRRDHRRARWFVPSCTSQSLTHVDPLYPTSPAVLLFITLGIVFIISLLFTASAFTVFLTIRFVFHARDERGKGITGWREELKDRIGAPVRPTPVPVPVYSSDDFNAETVASPPVKTEDGE